MKTLLIIPALNEEAALPAVLKEVLTALPGVDVLVVDDGSVDATAAVARQHGAVVARLPFNLGTGGALRTGFRYAVEHDYDYAIQFDGDGQHDPGEVATLIAELDKGCDLVIGSRFSQDTDGYHVGRVRGGAMGLLRTTLRLLTGRSFSDTSSGFRGFSRPALELFARHYPVDYLSDTVEALLLACYAGLDVVEVPVNMRERAAGLASNRNVRLLYHYVRLMIVLLTSASRRSRHIARAARL